jgi:hypothetical protein
MVARGTTGKTRNAVCTSRVLLESLTAESSRAARAGADPEDPPGSLAPPTRNDRCPTLPAQDQLATGARGDRGAPVPNRVVVDCPLEPAPASADPGVREATRSLKLATPSLALSPTQAATEPSTKTSASENAELTTVGTGLSSAKIHWKSATNDALICVMLTAIAKVTCLQQTPRGANCFTMTFGIL